MSGGIILRLAAPLQSWGAHSAFNVRDTQRFPTRSGLIGLFAAALGLPRGADLTRFDPLVFTVRVDRPGLLLTDFHTVGGGRPAAQTAPTAAGGRRAARRGTIVTRRHYLADAAFTVAATSSDRELIAALAAALARPRWQLYLGRRSCPPEQPLLVHAHVADPITDLHTRIPIHAAPRPAVDVITDTTPERATTTVWDHPDSFDAYQRSYRPRPIAITPTAVPAALFHPDHDTYLEALHAYTLEAA